VVEFKPNQGGLNVANDLTHLTSHIEQVRQRLAQTAHTERAVVQELGDALKRFDQDTLQNVRTVVADHEARRSGILDELHALAGSIGTFRPVREPVEPVAISPADFFEQNPDRLNRDVAVENGHPHAPAVGDWRQATKNLSYADELDFLIRSGHILIGKSSSH
jgi:hypothetical protein